MSRIAPSLRALETLEAVVRLASLTRAAAELGVTVSAVSFQLRELERFAGRPLVRRDGRALAIDPVARAAAAGLAGPFAELRAAGRALRAAPRPARITVSMLPGFAAMWFLPRLPRLRALRPDLDVETLTASRLVDFAAEPVQCGIRCGPGVWPGLAVTRLFPQRLGLVAHRSCLGGRGRPRDPADLAGRRLVVARGREMEWAEWFAAAGRDLPAGLAPDPVDGRDLVWAMVKGGAAIGLVDLSLAAAELGAGEVVQLFEPVLDTGWHHCLVEPEGADDPAVAALRAWLLEEARG